MVTAEEYLRRIELARRDEQAQWNVQLNLEIALAAVEAKAWYRGEEDARAPSTLLSDLARSGNDGEKRGAHRRLSLARAMTQHQPSDTEAFRAFRETSYEALAALREMRDLTLLREAESALDKFFEYVERSASQSTEDARFGERVMQMLAAYSAIWNCIADALRDVENERCGNRPDNPYQARQLETTEAIAANVETLVRRERRPPASSTAVRWIETKWTYYNAHPEALASDVARRRITARDVWETIKDEAISRYGIADFAAFKMIMNNIRQIRYRRRHPPTKNA